LGITGIDTIITKISKEMARTFVKNARRPNHEAAVSIQTEGQQMPGTSEGNKGQFQSLQQEQDRRLINDVVK
jgi:hypothetical protein